jgi:tryptophan synthase beta chain
MVKKILLSESDIPERWYNILPDLPAPPFPYLNPLISLMRGSVTNQPK